MFKLKLNLVSVLGLDDVGKLTLNGNSQVFKLKLNHASVLGPDDVGKLTLNGNSQVFKLNSIMPRSSN